MILIFSENSDASTVNVIDWISFHFKKKFLRINSGEVFKIEKIEINGSSIIIEFLFLGKKYILNDFEGVWFRRGEFITDYFEIDLSGNKIEKHFLSFLSKEKQGLEEFVRFSIFMNIKRIGNPFVMNVNKLIINYYASLVGLDTPNSFVTTKKSFLENKVINEGNMITKPIHGNIQVDDEEHYYQLYTNMVPLSDINNFSDEFYYSYFQDNIIKDFEIRTFILEEKCYSMAIFSQDDPQTKIDFRRYNSNKPNRTIPYKLPRTIENKIFKLMKLINLNSGSLDLIKTKNGEIIFLEVNPVGQYGMVSIPCNYNLDFKIAEYLVKKS